MNKPQLRFLACVMLFLGLSSTPIFAQQSGAPQKKPQFPGGIDSMVMFLSRNVKYPTKAKTEMLEGTVYVGFIVEKDGTISSIDVKKTKYTIRKKDEKTQQLKAVAIENPKDDSLEKEAMRVVKTMPRWKAGEHNGEKVSVGYTLPIKFALN